MGMGHGMMGHGMMGHGMMGHGMMGHGMMGMGMQAKSPRTEGRLAFLEAELKITAAQASAWSGFAESFRKADQATTARMDGHRETMMMRRERPPAPDALQAHVHMQQVRLDSLEAMQEATAKLYAELDETQKQTADELLTPPFGMMGR